MDGQIDAVIGDAALRKVISADALRAVARSDLGLARLAAGAVGLFALGLVETRAQDLHGELAVLMLRFFSGDNDNAGWDMRDADGGIGFVDVLAAGTGGAHGIDANVLRTDIDVDVLGFGENSDGGGGRMNTALVFGGRHALDAVDAAFVFELGEHAATRNGGDDFAIAAEIVLRNRNDLARPAIEISVALIHTE